MTLYGLANYLHVLGAIGLGAVIVLEWLVVVRLRSTDTVEQARAWLSFTAVQQWAGPACVGAHSERRGGGGHRVGAASLSPVSTSCRSRVTSQDLAYIAVQHGVVGGGLGSD
jgi:hypothetical protein